MDTPDPPLCCVTMTMNRRTHDTDRSSTLAAIDEAIGELRAAARPPSRPARRISIRGLLRSAACIAAGAATAWQIFETAMHPRAGAHNGPGALDAAPSGRHHDRAPAAIAAASGSTTSSAAAPATDQASAAPAAGKVEAAPIALAKELVERFGADDGSMRAAALSFYAILSIVPILLFGLAVLGFFIHDPAQASGYVRQLAARMLPGAQAQRAALNVIRETHLEQSAITLIHGRWYALTLGLVGMLYDAISLFVTASAPMNAAWNVRETRGFVALRILCLAVFVGSGVLFALSLVPSSAPELLSRMHVAALGMPWNPSAIATAAIQAVGEVIAVLFDIALFVLIYRFLPNTQVTWRAALAGGVVVGILWEVFKKAFAVYLAHFADMNKMYGALGGLVLLVTWIYYSAMLLLVGAIICKMYQEHTEEGGIVPIGARKREAALAARTGSVPTGGPGCGGASAIEGNPP